MDADTRQIRRLERDIEKVSKRGIPIAIQQTINNTTRTAFSKSRENINDEFTTRNSWTERSTSWQRATGLDVDRMKGVTGTTLDYLGKQEEGFHRMSPQGVQVPTGDASGEGNTRRRTRPVKPRFRKSRIDLKNKRKHSADPKQQRLAEIIDTMRSGNRYWYGKFGNTRGLWFLKGGRVSKKGGWPKGMRPTLLYSADYKSVYTAPNPWLEPAADYAIEKQPMEYKKALDRQMDRIMKKGKRK